MFKERFPGLKDALTGLGNDIRAARAAKVGKATLFDVVDRMVKQDEITQDYPVQEVRTLLDSDGAIRLSEDLTARVAAERILLDIGYQFEKRALNSHPGSYSRLRFMATSLAAYHLRSSGRLLIFPETRVDSPEQKPSVNVDPDDLDYIIAEATSGAEWTAVSPQMLDGMRSEGGLYAVLRVSERLADTHVVTGANLTTPSPSTAQIEDVS